MITAKEALTLSAEGAKEVALQKYEPLIREAAAKGEREICLDYRIPEMEKNAMEGLGYEIFERDPDFYDKKLTTISW